MIKVPDMRRSVRAARGFTLVEVLVAFSILVVGIAGIITAFSAGLSLEQEGQSTFDGHYLLEELRPSVREELLKLAESGRTGDLKLARRPVPGFANLSYEVVAVPMPDDAMGQGYLVKIDIVTPRPTGERRTSLEYVPMILAPRADRLVRELTGAK